jgi:hypothetical protein
MQPLRIRISRIVDFGTVVSLVGIDSETAMAVSVHVDHRQFASVRQAWRDAGLPQPVEYAADRLMLHLDMLPAADADEVRLIEDDSAVRSPQTATRAVRDLDQ